MDHTDPPGMPEDERMQGVELKMVREWLALSGPELGKLLDVNPRTVRSWESGRDLIPDHIRLKVEHLEAVTAQAVTAGVEALMDLPEPTVLTYLSDAQYQEREPESVWPASWHRRVVMRIAQEVPGLVVVSPEEV